MISRWMKAKMMMLMTFFMVKKTKNPKVVTMMMTRIFPSTRGDCFFSKSHIYVHVRSWIDAALLLVVKAWVLVMVRTL